MTSQPTLLDLLAATPTTPKTPTRPDSQRLLEHLVTAGHITEIGISRSAKIRACPGRINGRPCRQPVLVGLDDDFAALEARTDPTPLTTLGELLACLEQPTRRTYELHTAGGRWELDGRDSHRIADTPPESTRRCDVLREHRCGSRPLTPPETATTSFAEAATAHLRPDSPPPF